MSFNNCFGLIIRPTLGVQVGISGFGVLRFGAGVPPSHVISAMFVFSWSLLQVHATKSNKWDKL